jgi:endonuclease YncB( thermonuclease family)
MVRTRAVVVAILAAASLGRWWLGRADRGGTQSAFVTRAVDGDTIDVRIARTPTRCGSWVSLAGIPVEPWIVCAPALCREIEPSRWMTLVPAVHRGRYEVRAGPTHA